MDPPSNAASRRLKLGIDDSQVDVFEGPDPAEQISVPNQELEAYRCAQMIKKVKTNVVCAQCHGQIFIEIKAPSSHIVHCEYSDVLIVLFRAMVLKPVRYRRAERDARPGGSAPIDRGPLDTAYAREHFQALDATKRRAYKKILNMPCQPE
jgi:hypothetical protein